MPKAQITIVREIVDDPDGDASYLEQDGYEDRLQAYHDGAPRKTWDRLGSALGAEKHRLQRAGREPHQPRDAEGGAAMKPTVIVWRCYTHTLGGWREWGQDFASHWDARKAIQRMEMSWPGKKYTIRRALVRL